MAGLATSLLNRVSAALSPRFLVELAVTVTHFAVVMGLYPRCSAFEMRFLLLGTYLSPFYPP